MMTAGRLSNLFHSGRPAAMPIAETGGEVIGLARFQADVAANAARIAATGCRRGLLATRDAYWGAVGLFALPLAGAEVIVPHNLQPGSLEGLRDTWDWIVQDRALEGIGPALMLEPAGNHPARYLGPVNPDAPLSFFTSGSTGTPKRIMKTFGMLEREAAAIEKLLGPDVPADAVVHATVNHQHVYGLAFRLCWPLATGRCFSGDMLELWENVLPRLNGRSVLVTSPAHLERLGGLRPLPVLQRSALLLSAGAPLSDAAARDATAIFGTQVLEIFGCTETGAAAFRRRGDDGCPWRALPGVTVERAADGRMRVISPFAVDGGVFVGADLVEVEMDGGLRFQGRTDRVVKIEGKRVELTVVENDLRRLPWVGEAVATGLDIGQRTPCLAAVVVPSSAGAALLAEIGPFRFSRHLRRDLAATQEPAGLPRRWVFVDRLPTGAMGKRNHADIEALFKERAVKPTEPETRGVKPLDGGGIELLLHIGEGLAQLEGHFPNLPIVPGVAQIDWAVSLAAVHLGLAIESAQWFQIKFRRVMLPGTEVTLTLGLNTNRAKLAFEYRAGRETLSSGSIRLTPP
jgi:hypothetical protein